MALEGIHFRNVSQWHKSLLFRCKSFMAAENAGGNKNENRWVTET